jgi:hypothetical protein
MGDTETIGTETATLRIHTLGKEVWLSVDPPIAKGERGTGAQRFALIAMEVMTRIACEGEDTTKRVFAELGMGQNDKVHEAAVWSAGGERHDN